jgi:hypothetical protein
MAMQDWMRWEPSKGRRFDWMLREPARIIVGIGAIGGVATGLMPWAEGIAPSRGGMEPAFFSGLGGSGDGVVLIFLSTAIGIVTLHRTPATSRVRSLRFAPSLLVVLAALTWLNGYRASLAEIENWVLRGGSGHIATGLWAAGVAIALMAAGTLWLLPPVIRWERRTDDPADLVRIGPEHVAEAVLGIGGAVTGGGLGISAAIAVTGPSLVGAIAIGAIFGGLLGAYAGSWIARAVARRAMSRGGAGASSGAEGGRAGGDGDRRDGDRRDGPGGPGQAGGSGIPPAKTTRVR